MSIYFKYSPGDKVIIKLDSSLRVRHPTESDPDIKEHSFLIVGHWANRQEYLLYWENNPHYSFVFRVSDAINLKTSEWKSIPDIDNYINKKMRFLLEDEIVGVITAPALPKKDSNVIDGAFCSQCKEFAQYQIEGFTCFQCREDRFRFKF